MPFALAASFTMALLNSPRYPRLEVASKRDRILIVAPHVDDETIGAGGYAIDAIENGAEVFVVYLTAGDRSRMAAHLLHKKLGPDASNYLSVGKKRIAEAHEAMSLLGLPSDHIFVLGYPDGGLRSMLDHPEAIVRASGTRASEVPYTDAMSPGAAYTLENVVQDLKQVIGAVDPTTVIAPVPFDHHADHASAAELTELALAKLEIKPKRLGYLVHSGRMATKLVNSPHRALLPPAKMKSLTWATYPLSPRVQELKTRMIMTYKSQMPYVFLLRNAFVRTNELFYVYPDAEQHAAADPARVVLAR